MKIGTTASTKVSRVESNGKQVTEVSLRNGYLSHYQMLSNKKVTVVIPAYNEQSNLNVLTQQFLDVFHEAPFAYDFVFVIQGEDGCLEEMRELQQRLGLQNMRILYFQKGIGVGPAHYEGFKAVPADADYVITMDADLNHNPKDLPRFFDALEKTNADLVLGSRKIAGGQMELYSPWKLAVSGIVNRVLPFYFGIPARDITSGYRLISAPVMRKILPQMTAREHEFYVEFLIRAQREAATMVEVPIHFKVRMRGESKLRWLHSLLGYLKMLRLRFRE